MEHCTAPQLYIKWYTGSERIRKQESFLGIVIMNSTGKKNETRVDPIVLFGFFGLTCLKIATNRSALLCSALSRELDTTFFTTALDRVTSVAITLLIIHRVTPTPTLELCRTPLYCDHSTSIVGDGSSFISSFHNITEPRLQPSFRS